jgi:hypothetical protein
MSRQICEEMDIFARKMESVAQKALRAAVKIDATD